MKKLALAIVLAATNVAGAQPNPTDPAEVAYQEGKRLYDIQEWDAAIAKFKEAYKLRSDQASLFNIAQAYRLKGDCQQAINGYKTYKRNFPNADNIPKVEKFITDLEGSCKPGTTPPPTTNPTTNPDPQITTNPSTNPEVPPTTNPNPPTTDPNPPVTGPVQGPVDAGGDPGKTKRLVGYGLIAVGGIGLVAGVGFAMVARSKASDVSEGGMVWDPTLEADGLKAQRNSRIGLVVGGLALAGGVTLVILGKSSSESNKVSLAPSTDGGMVVWSGGF